MRRFAGDANMPDGAAAADACEIIPDERSLLLLAGLISIEFVTLLAILIWMR
jgi:hypothetical protein